MKKYLDIAKLWGVGRFDLLIVLFVATGVRLYRLGAKSVWHDEILHYRTASLPIDKLIPALMSDVHPPLGFLAYWPVAALTKNAFLLRLPSALFGAISVAVYYQFVKRIIGRSAAIYSSLIFALCAGQVYLSQTLRMYALFSLLSMLTLLFFVSVNDKEKGRYYSKGFILFAVLTLYTHNYGVFLLAGLFLLDVFRRKMKGNDALLKIIKPYLLIAAFYLPWLIVLVTQYGGASESSYDWLLSPDIRFFTAINSFYLTGLAKSSIAATDLYLLFGYGLILTGAIVAALREKRDDLLELLITGLSIVMLIFLASFFRKIAFPRYLVFVLPFAILPFGFLLAEIPRWTGNQIIGKGCAGLLLIAIVLIEGNGLAEHYNKGLHQAEYKGDWKKAAEFYRRYEEDNLPVIVLSKGQWSQFILDFYLPADAEQVVFHNSEKVIAAIRKAGEAIVYLNNTVESNPVIDFIEKNFTIFDSVHFLGGHGYRLMHESDVQTERIAQLTGLAINLEEERQVESSTYYKHAGAAPLTLIHQRKQVELMRGQSSLVFLVYNEEPGNFRFETYFSAVSENGRAGTGTVKMLMGKTEIGNCVITPETDSCTIDHHLKKAIGFLVLSFIPDDPRGGIYIDKITVSRKGQDHLSAL